MLFLAFLCAGCAREICWGDDARPTCRHAPTNEERVRDQVARDFHCYQTITISRRGRDTYDVSGCGRTGRYDCGWARNRRRAAWICDAVAPARTLPALRTQQVEIGTAPTLLVDADDTRASLVVTNTGGVPFYVAATPTVSADSGQAVLPGGSLTLREYKGALFAIALDPVVATYAEETRIAPSWP
jgi:hypothetical protein